MLSVSVEVDDNFGPGCDGVVHACLQCGPLAEVAKVADGMNRETRQELRCRWCGPIVNHNQRVSEGCQSLNSACDNGPFVVGGYNDENISVHDFTF